MNKKKIGIITFHSSHNCGSMLQAYALQTVLEKRYGAELKLLTSLIKDRGIYMGYLILD